MYFGRYQFLSIYKMAEYTKIFWILTCKITRTRHTSHIILEINKTKSHDLMKDLWGVLCMFWDAKYSSSRERKLFINYYIYWEEIAQGPAKDPVLNTCGPRYNPYQSLNYDDTRWLAQLCFEIIRICHCLCVCRCKNTKQKLRHDWTVASQCGAVSFALV